MRLAAVVLKALETYYGVVLFEKLPIWKAIGPYKVAYKRSLLALVCSMLLLGIGL